MRLKRLLLGSALALSFVVTAPTPAKADPITATITAISVFASSAVGSFIVNAALTAAVSWGASKLQGKNKAGVAERQASVQSLSLGEVPREALLGETITGGSLVDVFNHGGQYGTDYVTRCIALADHSVDALVGYYIDDVFYAWTGNGLQPGFGDALDMEFVNASATGTSPPARWLSASGWSNTDVGVGVTRIWVSCKFDEKVWPQGLPQIRFVLRGLKVYDARKDPGLGYVGAGAQTWDDPSTHAWSRNATLLRYATVRGIYVEGHQGEAEHLLIGRGLTPEEAPPARIIAAANLCDEDVDGDFAPGTTLYMVNGTIRASDSFISVEEMFAAAMAGVIVQREGGVEIEPGQAKAAVLTITDDDLVVGEPVTFSDFLTDGDGGRINTVVPRYVSPEQNWKDFAGPVRRDLADIAEDGGPREMTLPLVLVTDGRQADWCAEIVRRSSRLERRATVVLPPDCSMLEEGDWIAWQSARHHAGATVRYQIAGWSTDASWRMRLSLREIASSVFGVPYPVESTALPPPAPVPVDALALNSVAAEAAILAGDTSTMPGVRFTWATPVDGAMTAIRAEVRRVGETEAATARTEDLASGVMVMSNGVPADAAIEGRLVPIGNPTRPVLPSVWFPLSTAQLVAGDVDPTSPTVVDLFGDITDIFGDLSDLSGDLVTETTIRAQQVSNINTRLIFQANKLLNSNFTDGLNHWSASGWSVLSDPTQGTFAYMAAAGTHSAISDTISGNAGATYSVALNAEVGGVGGNASVFVTFYSGASAISDSAALTFANPGWGRVEYSFTMPTGTNGFRVVARKNGAASYLACNKVMVNGGPVALPWNDQASNDEVGASVISNSLAIIDLETQQALAYYEVVASASGGAPARLRLVSSSLGSAVALDAPFIYFGGNTVFDDATDTLRTTTGGTTRVIAWGAPFGTTGDLTQWEGPSSIAFSAMSRANAFTCIANAPPYVDGTSVRGTARTWAVSGQIGAFASYPTVSTNDPGGTWTVGAGGRWEVEVKGTTQFDSGASFPAVPPVFASGYYLIRLVRVSDNTIQWTSDPIDCSARQTTKVGCIPIREVIDNPGAETYRWQVALTGRGSTAETTSGTVDLSIKITHYTS